jgi:hypothetical protein
LSNIFQARYDQIKIIYDKWLKAENKDILYNKHIKNDYLAVYHLDTGRRVRQESKHFCSKHPHCLDFSSTMLHNSLASTIVLYIERAKNYCNAAFIIKNNQPKAFKPE